MKLLLSLIIIFGILIAGSDCSDPNDFYLQLFVNLSGGLSALIATIGLITLNKED